MLRYFILVMTFSFFGFANIPPNTYKNQLTSDTYNKNDQLITQNAITLTYDANDNRIAKTTSHGTTTYLIDTNTPYAQVITESKANGTIVEYTYGNDLLSDGTHNFLTDALGSTRGLVDINQNLTDSYTYTPYGKLTDHNGTSANNFLFTGEQFDSEVGDYYLRARYYSPDSGRFISRDSYDGTLDSPLSQNHYLYTHGNPIRFVDPSGNAITTQQELSFNIAVIGELSTSQIASLVKVSGGILSKFRDNKKYNINIDYNEAHSSIFATYIDSQGGYKYDFVYDEMDDDIPYDLFDEPYKRVNGWIRKRELHGTNQYISSFVKLSEVQFEIWEEWIFRQYPKIQTQPNTRAHIYQKGTYDCRGYAQGAYLKAMFIMLTTPSI